MRVTSLQIRVKQSNYYEPNKHIHFVPLEDIPIYGKISIFVKYDRPCVVKGSKTLTWKEVLVATNPEKAAYLKVGVSGEIVMDGDSFYLIVNHMVILRTKNLRFTQNE